MKKTHSLPVALALTATLGLGLSHADVDTTPQFGNDNNKRNQGQNQGQNQGHNQGTGNGYYQPPVYHPYYPPAPQKPPPPPLKQYKGLYMLSKDKNAFKDAFTKDSTKAAFITGVDHAFRGATAPLFITRIPFILLKDPKAYDHYPQLTKQTIFAIVPPVAGAAGYCMAGAVTGAAVGAAAGAVSGAAAGAVGGAAVGWVAAIPFTLVTFGLGIGSFIIFPVAGASAGGSAGLIVGTVTGTIAGTVTGGAAGYVFGGVVGGNALHAAAAGITAAVTTFDNTARRKHGYAPLDTTGYPIYYPNLLGYFTTTTQDLKNLPALVKARRAEDAKNNNRPHNQNHPPNTSKEK